MKLGTKPLYFGSCVYTVTFKLRMKIIPDISMNILKINVVSRAVGERYSKDDLELIAGLNQLDNKMPRILQ